MKTFDLTQHILDQYKCDFWAYFVHTYPDNDNSNIVQFEVRR